MNKSLKLVLIILILLVGLSEFLLPLAASLVLDRALNRAVPTKTLAVTARSFPGIRLAFGDFGSVRSTGVDARIGLLGVKEMQVEMEDARIDMGTLIANNRLVLRDVKDLQIMMKFTEKDLAEYMNKQVKEVKDATVAITPGKIEIKSGVDLGIIKFSLNVSGRIVGDDKNIRFVSDTLKFGGTGGPSFGATIGEIVLVDLAQLPFKVGVRKVSMETGAVTIHADNHF